MPGSARLGRRLDVRKLRVRQDAVPRVGLDAARRLGERDTVVAGDLDLGAVVGDGVGDVHRPEFVLDRLGVGS